MITVLPFDGRRSCLTPYDTLIRTPRTKEVVLMRKSTGRHADLYDVIGAVTSIILAAVAVAKLIRDIVKDKQQESNRHSPK